MIPSLIIAIRILLFEGTDWYKDWLNFKKEMHGKCTYPIMVGVVNYHSGISTKLVKGG